MQFFINICLLFKINQWNLLAEVIMVKLVIFILSLQLLSCVPNKDENIQSSSKPIVNNIQDGTSSGGGSCKAEFSCKFNDEGKNLLGVMAICDKLQLVTFKNDQWVPLSSVEVNRRTIFRNESEEFVLLFKRKILSESDSTPWVQLEAQLERKIHSGPDKGYYPAILSGSFLGLSENFQEEQMTCKAGWYQD